MATSFTPFNNPPLPPSFLSSSPLLPPHLLPFSLSTTTMKLTQLSPKNIYRSIKYRSRSVSRSGSDSSSSSSSSIHSNLKSATTPTTPTTVLTNPKFHLPQTRSELELLLNRVGTDPLTDHDLATALPRSNADSAASGSFFPNPKFQFPQTRAELETLLSRVGADPVSEEELTMALTEEPVCSSEIREAFDFFDLDRDGKISADELCGVFRSFGDEECTLQDCRKMIEGVDSNGDGVVCFEDFCLMMEHQRI